MADHARDLLIRQFDTAWQLAAYHLRDLSTEESLWRPAPVGLNMQLAEDGGWRADWPDHEGYTLGPPSIAWITWHMGFWWSMTLDHSFGEGRLTREDVEWPGSGEQVCEWLHDLSARWRRAIVALSDEDVQSTARTRWPFTDRPFGDVIAWLNVELAKNAAEIGYARFLYAVR